MKLAEHPRLFIGRRELTRLRSRPKSAFLKTARESVARNAALWAKMPPLAFKLNEHNSFLTRAREVQTRIITLITRWRQTDDPALRGAVMNYIRMIGEWECWSWITWRKNDYNPAAIYDLSYGENSATLAIAYDLLYETLARNEKQLFLDIASKWSFASGTIHCQPGGSWWYGKPDSNWNTVCAGGLGMLCLAMYEDLADAKKLLPMADKSFIPYMRHLDETSGAWPEGVGYWNYGMCYAFIYLLSSENSTGRRHPLMQLEGTRKTLDFPLDFCPGAQACSFGDVNSWIPLPFHYAAATKLRAKSALRGIDIRLREDPQSACRGGWAAPAGWMLFHDDRLEPAQAGKPLGARLYTGLDWAVIADRQPKPRLFMSVRGGTTKVPHGHCDLFSFNVAINGDKLIANEGNAEYLDTTFSSRRYELPDINAQYKNTMLINGVGVFYGAALDSTRAFNRRNVSGVRMIGGEAMGMSREEGSAASFCGRLILMLKSSAFLVIDRVVTPHPARIESRLHTHAKVTAARSSVVLHGVKESLKLAFAANVPALLAMSATAPTTPTVEPARMLRWCTRGLHTNMVLAALLVPGSGAARLSVHQENGVLTIGASAQDLDVELEVSEQLELRRMK